MRALVFLALAACSAAPIRADEPAKNTIPPAFSKLGAPCESELPTGAAFACGRGHRIASLTIPFQQMPQGTVRFKKMDPQHPNYEGVARVEIDGSHVWIENSCGMCRMMMFTTTVVDLALVEDDDLGKAQLQAGLPASPILRTPAAWNRAMNGWETVNLGTRSDG